LRAALAMNKWLYSLLAVNESHKLSICASLTKLLILTTAVLPLDHCFLASPPSRQCTQLILLPVQAVVIEVTVNNNKIV